MCVSQNSEIKLSMSSNELKGQFERLAPEYKRLVDEIRYGIESELNTAKIATAAIEGRVKVVESFLEKVRRKKYENPLADVEDIAGLRIVCLFTEDLPRIESVIDSLFEMLEKEDKLDSLGIEKMGYQGHHFVVRIGSKSNGPRYRGLNHLKAEIQVRTTLQDAWARISHNLVYKSEASIPVQLRREFQNVSSLLEIAQSIFDRTEKSRKEYIETVRQKATNKNEILTQPIDRETLQAYTLWRFPDLPVKINIQELLLRDINPTRYKTLEDIHNAVGRASEAVAAYSKENPEWFKSGTDYLTKSLGFVDTDFRATHPFGKRTFEAFKRFASLVAK